ncbi:zf-C3HC-domain-containing protein [Amylocystis lapponica]|nr:zf-C3HC-domain-containing protein [Amylocystis lapponica]
MSISVPGPSSSSVSSTTMDPPVLYSERNIKRKLEDAIHGLDEAVGPSPSSRLRTGRSIYATLAKYGIKTDPKPMKSLDDLGDLSKSAPHLAAILSRTATRTRKALPFKLGNASPASTLSASRSVSAYRPSSMSSFLSRLATYKLSTYGNKPSAIDAVAAAKCGWINDGRDRLVCGICDISWVVASTHGMSRDAANTLIEKQHVQLVGMHKDGCPWKKRQCDASIYQIPLQAPLAMAREIKARAIALDAVLQDVELKHPMTSAQVQSLVTTISSVTLPTIPRLEPVSPEAATTESISIAPSSAPAPSPDPSETAILAALFGWSVLPPAPPAERPRAPSSVSRANSVMPSTSDRAPSPSPSIASLRDGTPTPGPSRTSSRPRTSSVSTSRATSPAKPATTLLHCSLCQRRVGLWAFIPAPYANGRSASPGSEPQEVAKTQPQRQLDILGQHRAYCPYIVRSTAAPSMPRPLTHGRSDSQASLMNSSTISVNGQPGAVEGWRAVLTVVLRHGIVRRQRLGLARVPSGRWTGESAGAGASGEMEESPYEVDPVEAMVAGVKTRGGKDLLKYVRGLLA